MAQTMGQPMPDNIEITQTPTLGTVRLIARRMLYVKCVCLHTTKHLHSETFVLNCVMLHKLSVNLAEKINVPHHSDSHCRCMGSMISSTSVPFDEQSSADDLFYKV